MLLQRVIEPDDVAKYLSGKYPTVQGFMTRAQDVKMLDTPEKLFNGLRLDYVETPHAKDKSMFMIRFKAMNPDQAKAACGGANDELVERVAGRYDMATKPWTRYGDPFTGHGFTKSTSPVVPEYKHVEGLRMADGAELIEMTPDGQEVLIAVWDVRAEKFVPVARGG
jgi:toxin YxiD